MRVVGEAEEGGMEEGGMEEAGVRVNRDAREAGVTIELLERLEKVLASMCYATAQTIMDNGMLSMEAKLETRNDLKLIFTPTKAGSRDTVYLDTNCGGYGKHSQRS